MKNWDTWDTWDQNTRKFELCVSRSKYPEEVSQVSQVQ